MPKVSVIVPVYGVEKYVERCARSLFEQTLDDIEYLFIDDCTPDKSIEILKKVLKDYPQRNNQVIIHRMESNSGQAAVRKWGMLNSTGDYVIHCDSVDDDERVGCSTVAEGSDTTDGDGRACTHGTARIEDGKARYRSLESLADISHRPVLESLAHIDSGNGSGEVGLLLCTVTHDDYFIEELVVHIQCDIHIG